MSEAIAAPQAIGHQRSGNLLWRMAWRNVGRNRRRTWLTAGGIAFAILLVSTAAAIQDGSYADMRTLGTRLMAGELQISHAQYPDDARLEYALTDVNERIRALNALPEVKLATPRVMGFALASAGERSTAGQIIGLDVDAEIAHFRLLRDLPTGRPPARPGEAAIGAGLARNLAIGVGDELVLLGSSRYGGVAAFATNITGIVQSGIAELDRTLIITLLDDAQEGFELDGQAHHIVVLGHDPAEAETLAARVRMLPAFESVKVRSWHEFLPEVYQAIELDRISGNVVYAVLIALVGFSVVNTFIMVVFERTREFGMLRAIGMRPWSIIALLQCEALLVYLLGLTIAVLIGAPLFYYLITMGIPLGESMQETAAQIFMPSHMYAALSPRSTLLAPVVMLIGVTLAAFFPSLRVRKLRPVDALRSDG